MTDSIKVGIRENIELIDDGNFDESAPYWNY